MVLRGDYPELVKQRAYLAARGAMHGRRVCLLCRGVGYASRVHVPVEALRVDNPEYGGIRCYWLCLEHSALEDEDERIVQALAAKRSPQP